MGFPSRGIRLVAIAALVGVGLVGCRQSSDKSPRSQPVDKTIAEQLYQTYCADCHGARGDGQGRFANWFRTPPTDFRRGVYKFKRTPSGQPPTDEDIFRTLTLGVRGTGMVPQLHLTEAERWGLVAYLKSLSPVFQNGSSPEPLVLPPRPNRPEVELRALGRAWYERAGCVQCHGPKGRGDGPAASTLTDMRGNPVVMPDLTLVPYKQGEDVESILWVLLTGRDGTPMPSYKDALTAEQLWAIAVYVQSLQRGRRRAWMMGLIGEEVLAMRIDMEAVHAWRMGQMPMMRRMRRMFRKNP